MLTLQRLVATQQWDERLTYYECAQKIDVHDFPSNIYRDQLSWSCVCHTRIVDQSKQLLAAKLLAHKGSSFKDRELVTNIKQQGGEAVSFKAFQKPVSGRASGQSCLQDVSKTVLAQSKREKTVETRAGSSQQASKLGLLRLGDGPACISLRSDAAKDVEAPVDQKSSNTVPNSYTGQPKQVLLRESFHGNAVRLAVVTIQSYIYRYILPD